MSFTYGADRGALENRRSFLDKLGIDCRDLVCAGQIHGNRVKFAGNEDKGRGSLSDSDAIPQTDAFVTDKRNLPLAVFTADCLPVFLYDSQNRAIGLIHAGWKGTKGAVTQNAAGLMREKFNTEARFLYAGFGPCIRECCYEVGEEFNAYFTQGLTQRDERYYLDLAGINKKQLLALGVKEENIIDSKICTCCRNAEFFSYRKEGPACGRMISVTMLK